MSRPAEAAPGTVPPQPEPVTGRALVFSDLDGTLLDHETYDFAPAVAALQLLRTRGIPLVLVSSKARAEIEGWRRRLGETGAFVSENGGAIHLPAGWPAAPLEGEESRAGWRVVVLGERYSVLREALFGIARETGLRLRGFGDMRAEEIAALTRLTLADAGLAAQREYDEPFVVEGPMRPADEQSLHAAAAARGLRITHGGRFHHLLGASDKGEAVRRIAAAWRAQGGPGTTVAMGDGANDVAMLLAVDCPVVIARPGGGHAASLRAQVPHALFTSLAGPAGCAAAIGALFGPRGHGPAQA